MTVYRVYGVRSPQAVTFAAQVLPFGVVGFRAHCECGYLSETKASYYAARRLHDRHRKQCQGRTR